MYRVCCDSVCAGGWPPRPTHDPRPTTRHTTHDTPHATRHTPHATRHTTHDTRHTTTTTTTAAAVAAASSSNNDNDIDTALGCSGCFKLKTLCIPSTEWSSVLPRLLGQCLHAAFVRSSLDEETIQQIQAKRANKSSSYSMAILKLCCEVADGEEST